MRSNYKKIGLYVQQANQRNKDMLVTNLRGININKEFMPSVANTNGVDLSKYKIVSKHLFAFNPMHVGRDEMLPISMLNSDEPVIVSPAYTVFEIKNHEELDPEYLMMWCRRPEFDRNAWFTTDSSVRGGFSWADFCEMELPVPSIEKQREIVAEYNTIVNRIQLNENMNQKLEETAQAIYKHWFVDFEFPISAEYAASIGKPGLESKPYKSNGGEMVLCEESSQEIPKDWDTVHLTDMADISAGGDRPKTFSEHKTNKCSVPIFSNGTTDEGLYGYTDKPKVNCKSITIAARGGIGFTALRNEPYVPIVRLIILKPKLEKSLYYLFETAKHFRHQEGTSSAQSQLTVPNISQYNLLKPTEKVLVEYDRLVKSIYSMGFSRKIEHLFFADLLQIINTKMARAA